MKNLSPLFLAAFFATSADASTFAGVRQEEPKCFEQKYSDKQLARRPKQSVSAMKITLLRKNADRYGDAMNFIDIKLRLRGKKHVGKVYSAEMICEGDRRCMIECDGGSVELARTAKGLILKSNGFVIRGACGEGEIAPIFLKARRDGDDVFALTPTKSCQQPKWFKELLRDSRS